MVGCPDSKQPNLSVRWLAGLGEVPEPSAADLHEVDPLIGADPD
ncbi:MAG: TilS substrate-binding domain-containing protein [Actinomycetales bacterium]|nr:TilS substrate-binding domain-containing protein [Actinomycetales bacterium]